MDPTPASTSATTREVAGRIAALHNSEPARTQPVNMVGTEEVRAFIARISEAKQAALAQVLSLD